MNNVEVGVLLLLIPGFRPLLAPHWKIWSYGYSFAAFRTAREESETSFVFRMFIISSSFDIQLTPLSFDLDITLPIVFFFSYKTKYTWYYFFCTLFVLWKTFEVSFSKDFGD
ncbi:hypothetical protein RchiOBHm_Chr1g0371161 [Rosa chinensis]|uniref:Uncharacterized protein n=1 Tax=Rosa chinensis TaxID=74649 RepID=A0A2P6SLG0_ROSCH|nr:hypothetical protein RchiOBHm_Chr1g0371161 [Rosa chinensis]